MLEDKDRGILALLLRDGRTSVVEISNELRIPRATVQERVRKMIEAGVIKRFTAIPDYSKLGQPVTAYIFVSFRNEKDVSQHGLAEEMARIPQVYEVSVISGEWDILLKVRAGSVEEIGRLVVEKLRMMRGIERTETCVSFQTIKEVP
jgi:Lrp/AsnC family leucine-responsive transcriptional regulator